MDDERDERSQTVVRARGAWFWLIGAAITAAALYYAVPLDGGRPSSMTVFGISAPGAQLISYPALRMRPEAESRVAAVEVAR